MAVFSFYKLWEKCYPKSYKCVIIQQGKKNFIFTIFKFRARRYGDMWPMFGKPWREKRRCTLHAGVVSEEFANLIPKDERPANTRDVNPLETIWIIVDEITYKDPAPKTLDELRQRVRLVWNNANIDTRFGSSYILYLTAWNMSEIIEEDILVTHTSVGQC